MRSFVLLLVLMSSAGCAAPEATMAAVPGMEEFGVGDDGERPVESSSDANESTASSSGLIHEVLALGGPCVDGVTDHVYYCWGENDWKPALLLLAPDFVPSRVTVEFTWSARNGAAERAVVGVSTGERAIGWVEGTSPLVLELHGDDALAALDENARAFVRPALGGVFVWEYFAWEAVAHR